MYEDACTGEELVSERRLDYIASLSNISSHSAAGGQNLLGKGIIETVPFGTVA